jgi:hypothetical protein
MYMYICICIPAAPRAPVRRKTQFFVFSSRTRGRARVVAWGSEASAHTHAYEYLHRIHIRMTRVVAGGSEASATVVA